LNLDVHITPAAAAFYRQEMELSADQALRLFVRIGGFGCGGYSIGVQVDRPTARDHRVQVGGVTFVISPDDSWYMEGLVIDHDPIHGICCASRHCDDLHHPDLPEQPFALAV
jgi:uncharacterized protein YneR